MAHALLNRVVTKPGQRDQVLANLIRSGKVFDDNPACLLYLVGESVDDPDVIWVVDLWTSDEEHAEALRAPELRPSIEETTPLLESLPEQIGLRLRGGKGLPDD